MPACEGRAAVLVAVMLLGGCVHRRVVRETPVGAPHYVVGGGYEAGGFWYYPAERFEYAQSGVAMVAADHPAGLTADGEAYDPQALAAAHQTLQLPAVAVVTDLDTGRQVTLRINDRGPADPRRIIALTPRAGELLGIAPGGVARVTVATDPVLSRALAEQLGGGPRVAVETAPEAAVTAEDLPAPGAAPAVRQAAVTLGTSDAAPAGVSVPERMPERVSLVGATGGALFVELGQFSRFTYANRRAARLGGIGAQVAREREGRTESYRVRAGPFASIAEADDAMDQALAAGVTDARIRIQ